MKLARQIRITRATVLRTRGRIRFRSNPPQPTNSENAKDCTPNPKLQLVGCLLQLLTGVGGAYTSTTSPSPFFLPIFSYFPSTPYVAHLLGIWWVYISRTPGILLLLLLLLLLLFYAIGINVPEGGLKKISENEKAGV